MATIDDLAPVAAAPIAPKVRMESGATILVIVTADGRLHRLALTPAQFGALAGDVATVILKQPLTH